MKESENAQACKNNTLCIADEEPDANDQKWLRKRQTTLCLAPSADHRDDQGTHMVFLLKHNTHAIERQVRAALNNDLIKRQVRAALVAKKEHGAMR